jgi:hypothetical protein
MQIISSPTHSGLNNRMDPSTVGLPLLDLSSSSLVTSPSEELTSLLTMSDDVSTVSIDELFSSSNSTVGSATTHWDSETTSDLLTFSPDYEGGGGGDADRDYSFCRYAKRHGNGRLQYIRLNTNLSNVSSRSFR